jgi:hypothetical protein
MGKIKFEFLPNSTFISSIEQNKDIVDFVLMQSCKHNILANSSFSWWAAYLNSNPNKIVIAPKDGSIKLITTPKTCFLKAGLQFNGFFSALFF